MCGNISETATPGAAVSIGGLPFDVVAEGGNFGPPGAAAAGMPFVSGPTALGPLVYGMIFQPSEMMTQTIGGRVAILFAGGAGTFIPSAASPYPDLVLLNVAAYLDR